MSDLEYIIKKSGSGYTVSGPVLDRPSHFDSEQKALAFARYAIGAKSSGGFIVRVTDDGRSTRDFFQSGTHLSQDGLSKR